MITPATAAALPPLILRCMDAGGETGADAAYLAAHTLPTFSAAQLPQLIDRAQALLVAPRHVDGSVPARHVDGARVPIGVARVCALADALQQQRLDPPTLAKLTKLLKLILASCAGGATTSDGKNNRRAGIPHPPTHHLP